MSKTNIYEIFNEFEQTNPKERKAVLQKYDGPILRTVIQGAMHPNINYVIKTAPKYIKSDAPPGMSYSNMTEALDKVYIFVEGSKRVNPNLSQSRKEHLFIQILESLESREAEVFLGMILKALPVKGLNAKLVEEVWPGLLS